MKSIEEEKYHRRIPDLVWQLICSAAALHVRSRCSSFNSFPCLTLPQGLGTLAGWYLGAPDIGSDWTALITFVVHFYSKLYPNDTVCLYGLCRTSVVYLPYAMAAMYLFIGNHYWGSVAVSGLIVSQALYMLEWDSTDGRPTPKRNHRLAAPTWFKNLFGKEIADAGAAARLRRAYGDATAPIGRGFGDGGLGANTATTSGYNWGKGHRLGVKSTATTSGYNSGKDRRLGD